MTNVKHTPGPWQIEGRYHGPLGSIYLSTMHPMPIFELQPIVGDRDEHLANARLIAAAPELLDALKEIIEVLRKEAAGTVLNNQSLDSIGIKANNAIAKAEGIL